MIIIDVIFVVESLFIITLTKETTYFSVIQ